MSFEEQVTEVEDSRRLAIFVWTVADDLDGVVAMRRELFDGGGYQDFVEVLPGAWEQVSLQRENLLEQVLSTPQPVLEQAGLTNASLSAKLEAWNSARERMLDEFEVGGPDIPRGDQPAYPPPHGLSGLLRRLRPRRPLRRKRALKWLARTLAHADTLLGSLAGVVRLAEPFKELKEAVERVADDTSDSLADES